MKDARTNGQKYADSLKELAQLKFDLKQKAKDENSLFEIINPKSTPYNTKELPPAAIGLVALGLAASFPLTTVVVAATALTVTVGSGIYVHNKRKKQAANRKSWDLVGKFTDWRDGY